MQTQTANVSANEVDSKPTVAADSLLMNARAFARMLSISKPTLDRMKAAGKLPRHIELSDGCHRWNVAEVRDWIAAGCPAIKEWEARRRAGKGGGAR